MMRQTETNFNSTHEMKLAAATALGDFSGYVGGRRITVLLSKYGADICESVHYWKTERVSS